MRIVASVTDLEVQEAVAVVRLPDLYGIRANLAILNLYKSKGFKVKSTPSGGILFEGSVTLSYNVQRMVTVIEQEII